jgi:hypothetical protein
MTPMTAAWILLRAYLRKELCHMNTVTAFFVDFVLAAFFLTLAVYSYPF